MTIEERAREQYGVLEEPMIELEDCTDADQVYDRGCYDGYIAGATEQKVIDDAEWEDKANIIKRINYQMGFHDAVEKGCIWLKNALIPTIGEGMANNCADDFRKAMSNSPEFATNKPAYDAEYLQSKIDLHTKYMQEHGITPEQQLAELDEMRGRKSEKPTSPWHKVSEELPKMAHFTTDGDFSDLCVCINESGEHKILVLCENSEYTYWAYGYDGEGLYDEDIDGGEITHWMEIPELPKEN